MITKLLFQSHAQYFWFRFFPNKCLNRSSGWSGQDQASPGSTSSGGVWDLFHMWREGKLSSVLNPRAQVCHRLKGHLTNVHIYLDRCSNRYLVFFFVVFFQNLQDYLTCIWAFTCVGWYTGLSICYLRSFRSQTWLKYSAFFLRDWSFSHFFFSFFFSVDAERRVQHI